MKTFGTTCIAIAAALAAHTVGATVQEAYKLRLGGDADAAQAILEKAVAEEPDNAAAWYELARTKSHIGLENPRSLIEGMKDIQAAAEKASTLEPGNLIYAIWKAKACGTSAYIALKQDSPEAREKYRRCSIPTGMYLN